ncbi:FAD-binding oxidoreductase [Sphingomonas piscis]|uniref:FAD-binding oxidoreductase n=1 Tax=Sphingomonas piscis TaxID=2714943 RepID=A0A6G7YRF1_9SPHN|nr:FAD-binding oxidoreductase [Sphingomonas piscis]QIK79316.1 FAD-binding oxidoreductase [Sphingomonas piscis]
MNAEQTRLVTTIRDRFGPKSVVTDSADIAPWLTDWRGKFQGISGAMLTPGSTEEVAAIVSLASELRIPLVPQGGNTSMCGGATPPGDGSALLISLRRMNRIRSVSAGDRQAIAEAGVILSDLHDRVAEEGCRFPMTLGAKGSATIGGLIATNAGGTQVLRFGTMRSLVAGIEAVMPDGSVHNGLAALKKDNRGYNLDQLLVGAEGTLGIVTAATLRLFPAVAARTTVWCGVSSPEQALDLLRFLEERVAGIEGFEIVPHDTLALVLRHIPNTRSPLSGEHAWHVLIEATTSGDGDLLRAAIEEGLGAAHEAGHLADAAIAANEAQAEAFWHLRDSIAEAERAHGASIAHDISVRVADMPRFIEEAGAEVERRFPGTKVDAFGHLGDGNVHFHVRALDGVWAPERAKEVSRLVYDLVGEAGGSVSAEHGIGQLKIGEFERLTEPARVAAVRAIKHALDPLGIMNPGKLVR